MKKYKVYVSYVGVKYFLLEAESMEEALNKAGEIAADKFYADECQFDPDDNDQFEDIEDVIEINSEDVNALE